MCVAKHDRGAISLHGEGQVGFLPQSIGCSDRAPRTRTAPTALGARRPRSRCPPGPVCSPLLRTQAPEAQGSSLITEPACAGVPGVAPGMTPWGEELRHPGQETQKHWPPSVSDQGSRLPPAKGGRLVCQLARRVHVRAFGILYRAQVCPKPDPHAPAAGQVLTTRSLPAPPRHPERCPPAL